MIITIPLSGFNCHGLLYGVKLTGRENVLMDLQGSAHRDCPAYRLNCPDRVGHINSHILIDIEEARETASVIKVGVGNEDLFNGHRINAQLFHICKKDRPLDSGVKKDWSPAFLECFHQTRKLPISFECRLVYRVVVKHSNANVRSPYFAKGPESVDNSRSPLWVALYML